MLDKHDYSPAVVVDTHDCLLAVVVVDTHDCPPVVVVVVDTHDCLPSEYCQSGGRRLSVVNIYM